MKNAPDGIGIMDKPPEPSPGDKAQRSPTGIKNKIIIRYWRSPTFRTVSVHDKGVHDKSE